MNIVTQPYRQPASGRDDNFAVTMLAEYDLTQAVRDAQADVELSAFLRFHPSGRSYLWAVRPAPLARGVWQRMRKDDVVLFHGNREVYAYGYVTAKVYWPDNDYIWPTGNDWNYLYALRDVTVIPTGDRPDSTVLRTVLPRFFYRGVQYHDLAGRPATDVLAPAFTRGHVPLTTAFDPPPAGRPQARPRPSGRRPPVPNVPATGAIGRRFAEPDFTSINSSQDLIAQNWQAIERGTLGHQQTVLALAQLVEAAGHTPTEGPPSVAFDLGWNASDQYVVCEIKSLTETNEANQIRLGLGQVLDYRHTLSQHRANQHIVAALVVEHEPRDRRWVNVCDAVGVKLAWPATMAAELDL